MGTPTHGKGGGTAAGVAATQPPVFHRRGSSSSLPSGSKASLSGECLGGQWWKDFGTSWLSLCPQGVP